MQIGNTPNFSYFKSQYNVYWWLHVLYDYTTLSPADYDINRALGDTSTKLAT